MAVFVLLPAQEHTPYLVLGVTLLAWTAGGYTDATASGRAGRPFKVLTPELTVQAIRGGYVPENALLCPFIPRAMK